MGKPHADFVRVAKPFFSGERETFATVLLGCLMTSYGASVLEWDPATVEAQVTDDFGVQMPDNVYDQVMALINVMANDTVYTSVMTFDHTVSALNRAGATTGDTPGPEELAWAVFEISANDPDPYTQGSEATWPFSDDICGYVGVCLQDAGFHKAPETLEFARMPEWSPSAGPEAEFDAATDNQQALADQVDSHIQELFQRLTAQLAEIGLKPASPMQEEAAHLPQENSLDALFR